MTIVTKFLKQTKSSFISLVFLVGIICPLLGDDLPQFRVVIDPGHGGVAKDPKADHGDKYDSITQSYLESYKQGTESSSITERKVVLDLGKELYQILKLTETEAGWNQFESYLRKFLPKKEFKRVKFQTWMTRESSFDLDSESQDPNAPYRLYDFPDKRTGERRKGRLSKINEAKPQLVVSLHLNPASKGQTGGMAVVLSPGYKTFAKIKKIAKQSHSIKKFEALPWSDWLVFQSGWSKWENALADTWIYFHGYWFNPKGKTTDLSKFEGYRQNMIQWAYADSPNWEKNVGKPGPYSLTESDFEATGKFWEREKSKKEDWRREGGREGFGGDNHYASKELLRFVQWGIPKLVTTEEKTPWVPGPIQKPYISTYSLPTYTNAIVAFLEIGYVNRKRDIELLTQHKKETAICLAVGIYSLFVGLETKSEKDFGNVPKGKPISWERYGNYFNEVTLP